jgi:hypothetical protein
MKKTGLHRLSVRDTKDEGSDYRACFSFSLRILQVAS